MGGFCLVAEVHLGWSATNRASRSSFNLRASWFFILLFLLYTFFHLKKIACFQKRDKLINTAVEKKLLVKEHFP